MFIDSFFSLTEDNKPPQLVTIQDGEAMRITIEDGFLTVEQFSEDQINALAKREHLMSESWVDIPPEKEWEITIPEFHQKVNVETEPWIDDPSAIPLPSNGLWSPERERYLIDFNNDGILDLLLGHGHSGIQSDSCFTLYLKNSEGKYRKHAVFNGMPDFAIEKKEGSCPDKR